MEYISIILAALLVNNTLLTEMFGIDPAIAGSNSTESAISLGLAITIITCITSVMTKVVSDLIPSDYEMIKVLVFVLIMALIIEIFYTIIKKSTDKFDTVKTVVPIVASNSLILGVSLMAIGQSLDLVNTMLYSLGVGLGFTLITLCLSAINNKYRHADLPKNFLEKPISFLALGLIALAFYGFKGML